MSYQPAPVDGSRRFLNMSVGALFAVITGIVVVCCVGPVALCAFSPVLSGIMNANKTKPDVAITSCEMGQGVALKKATIGLRVTNKGRSAESYTVRLEVRDASGARVGTGSEFVSDLGPGSSATEEATVYLDGEGGATCHVVGVN